MSPMTEGERVIRTYSLVVVLVLLALDDDLLQSVDELVSSLFWESILDDVSGSLQGVGSGGSVFLWDLLLKLVGLVSGVSFGLVSVDVG